MFIKNTVEAGVLFRITYSKYLNSKLRQVHAAHVGEPTTCAQVIIGPT